MTHFCTNCGTKIGKDDNFCYNCGIKIENDNFCPNCGTKLEKGDNFCYNCGSKINKSDIKPKKSLLKSVQDNIDKKMDEIAKEKEEEKKKLKKIDEIFESEEIKSEIRKNKINQINVISIKDNLKNKLIREKKAMSEEEIKDFIKQELKKAKTEQRKARIAKEEAMSRKIEKTQIVHGDYCSLNCRHCYEEFLDSDGGIVGDFDSGGYVEYYCRLGHPVSLGSFCEDYE